MTKATVFITEIATCKQQHGHTCMRLLAQGDLSYVSKQHVTFSWQHVGVTIFRVIAVAHTRYF